MALFTALETWKQARKIRNIVSAVAKTFPNEEKIQIILCSNLLINNVLYLV